MTVRYHMVVGLLLSVALVSLDCSFAMAERGRGGGGHGGGAPRSSGGHDGAPNISHHNDAANILKNQNIGDAVKKNWSGAGNINFPDKLKNQNIGDAVKKNWSGAGNINIPDKLKYPSNHKPDNFGPNKDWNRNWADHRNDWDRRGDWDHHPNWDYNKYWWNHHRSNWVGWWSVGVGLPWYGVGWRPGYYGTYSYYAAPYYGDVYLDASAADAYQAVPYTAAYSAEDTVGVEPTDGDVMDFLPQSQAAFLEGDYRNATRLAAHASIDDPRNPDVHLMLTLGLFAFGEYRGAAMEAHATVSLGKMPNWNKVFAIYGKAEPYTAQLRALEKYVREKPQSPEGRFLLGFMYLMANHRESAQKELLQALTLTPKDGVAAQLLTAAGGVVPEEIAKQLATESAAANPEAPAEAPAPPAPETPN